jgi:hypothetical protein
VFKLLKRTEPKLIAVFLVIWLIVSGTCLSDEDHDDCDEWWEITANNIT